MAFMHTDANSLDLRVVVAASIALESGFWFLDNCKRSNTDTQKQGMRIALEPKKSQFEGLICRWDFEAFKRKEWTAAIDEVQLL